MIYYDLILSSRIIRKRKKPRAKADQNRRLTTIKFCMQRYRQAIEDTLRRTADALFDGEPVCRNLKAADWQDSRLEKLMAPLVADPWIGIHAVKERRPSESTGLVITRWLPGPRVLTDRRGSYWCDTKLYWPAPALLTIGFLTTQSNLLGESVRCTLFLPGRNLGHPNALDASVPDWYRRQTLWKELISVFPKHLHDEISMHNCCLGVYTFRKALDLVGAPSWPFLIYYAETAMLRMDFSSSLRYTEDFACRCCGALPGASLRPARQMKCLPEFYWRCDECKKKRIRLASVVS